MLGYYSIAGDEWAASYPTMTVPECGEAGGFSDMANLSRSKDAVMA